MEHVDSLRSINSDQKITHIWDYKDHFREYLLLAARKNENALENRHVYPERIELSGDWHKSLEDIRQLTKDGKER